MVPEHETWPKVPLTYAYQFLYGAHQVHFEKVLFETKIHNDSFSGCYVIGRNMKFSNFQRIIYQMIILDNLIPKDNFVLVIFYKSN